MFYTYLGAYKPKIRKGNQKSSENTSLHVLSVARLARRAGPESRTSGGIFNRLAQGEKIVLSNFNCNFLLQHRRKHGKPVEMDNYLTLA